MKNDVIKKKNDFKQEFSDTNYLQNKENISNQDSFFIVFLNLNLITNFVKQFNSGSPKVTALTINNWLMNKLLLINNLWYFSFQ